MPTRRELFSWMTAAGAAPALATEAAGDPLWRLAASEVTLELAGQEPRTLAAVNGKEADGGLTVQYGDVEKLSIRESRRACGAGVLERTFEVYAEKDTAFNLEFAYEFPQAEAFYSWRAQEKAPVRLVQDTMELSRTKMPGQLFPFAAALSGDTLYGALGDTPGFWENRSEQVIDPVKRHLALRTGDGSAARRISTMWGDNSGFYNGGFDGWQHIRAGQTRRFVTWLFQAPARDLYAVRLASHRALAAGKGWNDSDLTAILRNNAYLQVRRNLLRPESRYILISGVNYGWKQWSSDAAMAGLGLEDREVLAEAARGLFWRRLNYEDNAQYYLILSALMARDGYHPARALCRRALEFLRDHESDSAYVPPSFEGHGLGWKSYMDLFHYADGDCPLSNQGFHCGALLAAAELRLGAGEADFTRACRAYARAFHGQGGYFPSSVMHQEVFGGDALYGATLTFAAFGRKCLPDELVLRHCRHAMKIQTRYGLRVFSKANGDLLEAN
jgi:hypothetical protein